MKHLHPEHEGESDFGCSALCILVLILIGLYMTGFIG